MLSSDPCAARMAHMFHTQTVLRHSMDPVSYVLAKCGGNLGKRTLAGSPAAGSLAPVSSSL